MSVKQRCIPCLLATVDMHPASAVRAVDFSPDVVLCVPNPSHSAADGTAEHGEAVCPLANTATPGLEQDEGIVVSGETLIGLAVLVAASVELNPAGTTS